MKVKINIRLGAIPVEGEVARKVKKLSRNRAQRRQLSTGDGE